MMMRVTLTKHMEQDRLDRYARIATEVGFGRTVMTIKEEDRRRRHEIVTLYLTSTGVLIIRNQQEEIVTMYCPTIKQVKKHFGIERLPQFLFHAICDNYRRGYCAD
jgi:hypothetical protein